MYRFFVGCDISKSVIDIAFHREGKAIYLGQFCNKISGFKQIISALKKETNVLPASWFICFENTGVYSKGLLEYLLSQGIAAKEENPVKISKSLGMRRGKDDKIDAQDICVYAYERRDSIQASKLSKPDILKLKKLLSRRDFLVRQKQALQLSLQEQHLVLDKQLYQQFQSDNGVLLKEYARQVKQIEDKIQEIIDGDDEMRDNYHLIQSVTGIGPIISAYMLAITENFSCFSDGRKFSCYAGVAPFPNRSGIKVGKTKVSQLANKKMKSLLSNGANAAILYDKEINLYYQKKRAQGKAKGTIINAVKNKLIHRVFAVVKRQSPYVKMMNYA